MEIGQHVDEARPIVLRVSSNQCQALLWRIQFGVIESMTQLHISGWFELSTTDPWCAVSGPIQRTPWMARYMRAIQGFSEYWE